MPQFSDDREGARALEMAQIRRDFCLFVVIAVLTIAISWFLWK